MDSRTVRSVPNQGFKMISRSAVPASAPPASAPKPKLLDQVRQAIRSRHLSYNTEQAYGGWIKRFILFHKKRHPKEMGELEIGQFLSSLATDAHVAASTQNQALNALLFLYNEVLEQKVGFIQGVVRAKRPSRLPVVLTKEEVQRVLNCINGTPWLMAMLLYGAGLRLMECCRLRVKDIDFEESDCCSGRQGQQGSLHDAPRCCQGTAPATLARREKPA